MTGDWPAGTARLALRQTDSTNAEALRRIGEGAGLPLWLLAGMQTAGRGRRGRAWAGYRGNFFATYAMEADDPAEAALRSFVAALALADALEAAGVPADALALKWPNDVLLAGGKLAGILLETSQQGGRQILLIGIGVNLARAPGPGEVEPGSAQPTALADHGVSIAPAAFLDLLAPALAAREAQFAEAGFAATRDDWLARAAHLGREITAKLPREELTGRFETVDAAGALVLDTATGRREVLAADVYF